MFRPLRDAKGNVKDALIYRRYKPPVKPDKSDPWTVPDDRKVNPWDLNERDPTDTGTMGTISGRVPECNVGDSMIVHFRNMGRRTQKVKKPVRISIPGLAQALQTPALIPAGKPSAGASKKSEMGSMPMSKAGKPASVPLQATLINPSDKAVDSHPDFVRVILIDVDEPIAIEHRSHSLHPHGTVF